MSVFRPIVMATRMRPIATKLNTVSFTPSTSSSYLSSLASASKFTKNVSGVNVASSFLRTQSTSTSNKVERPISPHVTIYAFPVPALSSIANRVTGVGMSVGVMGMSLVALGGGCDIPAYVESLKVAAPILMPVVKLVVGFPLVYHTAAGLRHLYWDKTAKGLDLESVEKSSKALIGGSVAVSLILAFYSLPALK